MFVYWVIDYNASPSPRKTGRATPAGFALEVRISDERARTLGPCINTMASRFHGASIAGLVVDAMGVFALTVALRHWLGERRRFGEDARA